MTKPTLFQDNVISTAYLVAQYLKNHNFTGKVYLIGSSGVTQELDAVGIEHVGTGVSDIKSQVSQFINLYFSFSQTL
jgi:phosphoglycolate phosphatase